MAAPEYGGTPGRYNPARPSVLGAPLRTAGSRNPYGVPSPTMPSRPTFDGGPNLPRGDMPYAGMEGIFSALTELMGGDVRRAQAVFDRYMQEYKRGRAIEDPLIAEDQALLSQGNLDPNDPRTFGRFARDARASIADRDATLRAIEASGLKGGELELAKASAITGAQGRLADARQGAMEGARDRLYGVARDKQMGFSPGEASGAAQSMLNWYGQKYGADIGAAMQKYGIDTNRDLSLYQGDRDYFLQKYGIDIGAAGQERGQDIEQEKNQRLYELERERMKRSSGGGFLGSLLGTLGTIGGSMIGGPIGGAIGGSLGGAIGSKAGKSNYKPGKPGRSAPKPPISPGTWRF